MYETRPIVYRVLPAVFTDDGIALAFQTFRTLNAFWPAEAPRAPHALTACVLRQRTPYMTFNK